MPSLHHQETITTVRLTFLGTGTSNGVPIIGCDCPVCMSTDPRDKRNRTSAVIHDDDDRIYLIDTATELRIQALAVGLKRVDAILMTHAHADHTGGFDDLRRFNEIQQQHLPVFANPETAAVLRERYAYTFQDIFPFYGGKPDLILHEVTGPFSAFPPDGRVIVPIPVMHGRLAIIGYRLGEIAYVTDVKAIPESSIDLLRGLDILVLNGLRATPHPTHISIPEAVEIIQDLAPRQAYLIHLSHDVSHAEASEMVPPGIDIAYDGLTVETG